MHIATVVPQLRTTDLAASIHFHTTKLGFTLLFRHEDFYAGIGAGDHVFHLKLVDERDPSVAFVARGEHFHLYFGCDDLPEVAETLKRNGVPLVRDIHETAWATRELVIRDDQGHTLYFAQRRRAGE